MMKNNKSRILLSLIIGVSRALLQQSISLNEAEQIIFSPAIVELSKRNSIDKRIVDLLHRGTELEDIESLRPGNYLESIKEIEKDAHNLLKILPEYDYNAEKLIAKLF